MSEIRFDGGDRPILDAKGFGNLVDDVGFGLTVLQGASAVGLNIAAPSQTFLSYDVLRGGGGLRHRDIIAQAWARYRLLESVGSDKYVVNSAVDIRAEFHGQFIVEQQYALSRLGECEPCVEPEGSACTTEVG